MIRRALLPILLATLTVAGCATKYAPLSGRGGYVELPQGANKMDVSFSGNGMVPPDLMEVYLLYRCAEVAKDAGFDYFIVLSRSTEPSNEIQATHPQYLRATIEFQKKEPGRGEWYKADELQDRLKPYVVKE